ncbi:MAG TPA: TIGR03118 family protein [Chitinophagaceae bacterium]
MKSISLSASVRLAIAGFSIFVAGCQKSIETPTTDLTEKNRKSLHDEEVRTNGFQQVNLVSDDGGFNPARIDANLQNAWGLAFAPSGPAWVNAQVTGISAVYNAMGGDVRPPVAIPSPGSPTGGGHPTGIVFNGSSGFKLSNGKPARFIFVGVDGVISGWNSGNSAERIYDNSATSVYTGLAIAANGQDSLIYAANFRTASIDVYDQNWTRVNHKGFRDFFLPAGYAPFNIQNVGGNLFVNYAKVADDGDEEKGVGNGFVDVYRPDGRLIRRFASRGWLNAPWGVAMAPDGFASAQKWDDEDDDGHHGDNDRRHHHDHRHARQVFLIGNFGDGFINAFNEEGEFLGRLRSNGKPIQIDGLWAISFAPSTATSIDPGWLFFAAGPDDETHGLFGYIRRQ